MAQDKILKMHLCALCMVNRPSNIYLFTYLEATRPKQQEKSNEFAMLFLAVFLSSEPRFGPKNKSKYKIWILNTQGSRWKWLNKSIHQLHTFKLYITISTKAIENQQFWKTYFGRFLVFWAQIWPKIVQKIDSNMKFEL